MKYILVVDDEIDILETIVDSLEIELEDKGVSISFSNLPVEALRMFIKENSFDLVVTDLKMPLMNGKWAKPPSATNSIGISGGSGIYAI
jgi:CheY-like chemotaxis protein